VSQVGTLCSGPSMSTGGTGGTQRFRDGKLPAGYRPPGRGQGTAAAPDTPTNGAPTSPIPADQAAIGPMQAAESLMAAVEEFQRRLTAQEQTQESLARVNDKLVDDVEALRKVDSHEEERRVAKSRRQSGNKTKTFKKTSKVTKDKSVRKDDPANAAPSSSSDDSASGSSPTSSDDDNPNATDTFSSDDGHGPPGPPSPPSGSSPSAKSSKSDAAARKRPATPTERKERLEKADMHKVIRPANSRFKTLLEYRTYFLIRCQLTYTPREAQRSHCFNKRSDGAFHGQQPLTGALLFGIFRFLTTFRRACDAAGLTHGQGLRLMVFRRAGNAKMAFSGALNSTFGR